MKFCGTSSIDKWLAGASNSAALEDSDSSDEDDCDFLLGLAVSVIESADQQLLSMPSLADTLSRTAVILTGMVTLGKALKVIADVQLCMGPHRPESQMMTHLWETP